MKTGRLVWAVLAALLWLTSSSSPIQRVGAAPLPAPIDVNIPILGYHKIDQTTPTEWFVQADEFVRQLDVLEYYGYTTIDLDDYLNYYQGIGTPPEKPILLTFDDGFQGVFQYAIPALKARGMTATLFLITGKLGEDESTRENNQDWNGSEPLVYHMIWPEAEQALADEFLIESHTVSHINLETAVEALRIEEINQSQADLQAHLGSQAGRFFAYPYGRGANIQSVRDLVAAKYSAAVGFPPVTPEGIANPAVSDILALPRLAVLSGHSRELNPSNPWWFFMRRVDPGFPIPNASISSFTVRDSNGNLRSEYYSGEPITATLKVSNWGSPVPAVASLDLLDTQGYLYRSHEQVPNQDVLTPTLKTGSSANTFTFTTLAADAAMFGPVDYSLRLRDPSFLLGYLTSAPTQAFSVQPNPISIQVTPEHPALDPVQEQDLVFSVNYPGTGAGEMYLTVSFSSSFTVTNSLPAGVWTSFPPGSTVKGCGGDCYISTSNPMIEAYESNYGGGTRDYTLRIRTVPGRGGPYWLRYRLSMDVPDNLIPGGDRLRSPLSGELDQQGFHSNFLGIGTTQYLPLLFK